MPQGQLTISQLGAQTKAKYPQYSKMSDEEVGNAVLKKYPEYKSKIVKDESHPKEVQGKEKEAPVTETDPFADVQPIKVSEDPLLTIKKEATAGAVQPQADPAKAQMKQAFLQRYQSAATDDKMAFQQGLLKVESGDDMGAYGDFTKAVAINPNNAKAIAALGHLSIKDDLPDDAYQFYTEAFKKEPNPNNLNGMARSQLMIAVKAEDKEEKAIMMDSAYENVLKVLSVDPKNSYALITKGLIERERGNDEAAQLDILNAQAAGLPPAPGIEDYVPDPKTIETRKFAQQVWDATKSGAPEALKFLTVDYINRNGEGAVHGVKNIVEGMGRMLSATPYVGTPDINESEDTSGATKAYFTGLVQTIHGAIELGLSAAAFEPSGYLFLQTVEAADNLTNGFAGKIVMAPVSSVWEPKEELLQHVAGILDVTITLGAMGGAKKAFSTKPGESFEGYVINGAANKIAQGKSLTGEETKLLFDAIKEDTNPEVIDKIVKALAVMPDNIPASRIAEATRNIMISDEASAQARVLQDERNVLLEQEQVGLKEIKRVGEIDEQLQHIKTVADDLVGRDIEMNGEIFTLKRDDEGNYVYEDAEGKQRILAVEDKNSPEASFEELGVKVLPELTTEQVKAVMKDAEMVGTVFSKNGNQFFISLGNPKAKGEVGDQVLLIGKNGKMKEVAGMTDEAKLGLVNKFLEERGLPKREMPVEEEVKPQEAIVKEEPIVQTIKTEEDVSTTELPAEPEVRPEPAAEPVTESTAPAEPTAEVLGEEVKAEGEPSAEVVPSKPELKLSFIDSAKLKNVDVRLSATVQETGQKVQVTVNARERHKEIKDNFKTLRKLIDCI